MTRPPLRMAAGALAALLLAAPPLAAQTIDEDDADGGDVDPYEESSAAWQAVFELAEPSMTGFQLSHLTWIAFHTAASKLCDDLVIDRRKMEADLGLFIHPLTPEMTDEELALHRDQVMVYVGMATGVAIAEHADDPASLCAEARTVMGAQDVAHLFDVDPDPEPQ